MRADLLFGTILVLLLIGADSQGFTDTNAHDLNVKAERPAKLPLGKRYKRWQSCDGGGFGGQGFGDGMGGGGIGGLAGANPFALSNVLSGGNPLAAGTLLGAGSLLGPWGAKNLGDIDPTTYILLALLSGAGSAVSPVPVGVGANLAPLEEHRLVPLPSSGQQKTPTTEAPVIKPIEEFNEELSYGLRPPPPQIQPQDVVPVADLGDKKPKGHVTPGNRCDDDSQCVAHAECVEALRQKYCVCSPGRRPKGGVCV